MVENLSQGQPDDMGDGVIDTSALEGAVRRYNTEVHTPELITDTWRTVYDYWNRDAERRGIDVPTIIVPTLEAATQYIESPVLDIEGNSLPSMAIYYPPQLRGRDGAVILGEMFPRLQTRTVKKNTPLQNMQDVSGWLNVEGTQESPNTDTSEDQLRSHFERTGRLGMNENQYILFAYFHKLTSGEFVDYNILNRLLGTRTEGYVVNSRFGSEGDLHVNSHLRPSLHGRELGGRSVKILKRN